MQFTAIVIGLMLQAASPQEAPQNEVSPSLPVIKVGPNRPTASQQDARRIARSEIAVARLRRERDLARAARYEAHAELAQLAKVENEFRPQPPIKPFLVYVHTVRHQDAQFDDVARLEWLQMKVGEVGYFARLIRKQANLAGSLLLAGRQFKTHEAPKVAHTAREAEIKTVKANWEAARGALTAEQTKSDGLARTLTRTRIFQGVNLTLMIAFLLAYLHLRRSRSNADGGVGKRALKAAKVRIDELESALAASQRNLEAVADKHSLLISATRQTEVERVAVRETRKQEENVRRAEQSGLMHQLSAANAEIEEGRATQNALGMELLQWKQTAAERLATVTDLKAEVGMQEIALTEITSRLDQEVNLRQQVEAHRNVIAEERDRLMRQVAAYEAHLGTPPEHEFTHTSTMRSIPAPPPVEAVPMEMGAQPEMVAELLEEDAEEEPTQVTSQDAIASRGSHRQSGAGAGAPSPPDNVLGLIRCHAKGCTAPPMSRADMVVHLLAHLRDDRAPNEEKQRALLMTGPGYILCECGALTAQDEHEAHLGSPKHTEYLARYKPDRPNTLH
jgi:hypothetical protein